MNRLQVLDHLVQASQKNDGVQIKIICPLSSEDILDVSRIESNSLILKKQQFNLNEMILNCVSDFRNQIKKENRDSNLKLEALFDSDWEIEKNKMADRDVFIEDDRNRLYQVVSNLISNAMKFTNEGVIGVSIERRNGEVGSMTNKYYDDRQASDGDVSNYVVVGVKDTGVGIDSEILPRLFTKFTTKSETGVLA